MTRRLSMLVSWLAILFTVVGCGGGNGSGTSSNGGGKTGADSGQAGVKEYSADQLPIGDYLPLPLDGGRVEIAAPKAWQIPPRRSDVLAWFKKQMNAKVPTIIVSAEEAKGTEFDPVTRENVRDFAQAVAAELKQAEKKLIEEVLPVILGDTACARYVTGGHLRSTGTYVEQQFLVTQANGRRYTIELQVLRNRLVEDTDDRDAAYAVAAGLKFLAKAPSDGVGAPPDDQPEKKTDEPEK